MKFRIKVAHAIIGSAFVLVASTGPALAVTATTVHSLAAAPSTQRGFLDQEFQTAAALSSNKIGMISNNLGPT